MSIPPINFVEVKKLAKQIAKSPDKKAAVVELLGRPDSEKRKQLDPIFVKAVFKTAKKIINRESGEPTLHKIKDWRFVQMIRDIQNRVEIPSEASLESADLALERELSQIQLEDYVDVCRSAQSLLQMYEHALPPDIKGGKDPENPFCSEGTKKYFYRKLKEKHDGISYLELDINAIATKSSLAVFMLTEKEDFMPDSLRLPDLKLKNVTNILSELSYPKKRDLILAYFMNPGTTAPELQPLMKSLFAIVTGSDKETEVEQVTDEEVVNEAKNKEPDHIGQSDLPLNTVRYVVSDELVEDEIDFGEDSKLDTSSISGFADEEEPKLSQFSIEIDDITQYVGRLLYSQSVTFPEAIDTSGVIDFDLDDDEFGGVGLVDESGRTPFASDQYIKQYVLHRQEILIAGMEEYIFDISFEDKLKLLPMLSGDEHRLRLTCVLINDSENDSEIARLERAFLSEVTDESLPDRTGYRASKGVEFYANLKGAEAVDKLVEFLDHEDHLVRYEAFKKLCDEDITGNPGSNALVEKIKKDIVEKTPSWALAAICKYSSSQYGSEIGQEDKYRAILIRVLMLKDIDIKDAFKNLNGLEVPFTLNLGEPTPGETEPLSLLEVIDYIGLAELVDITLYCPQRTVRNNARKILEVLLAEDPRSLDDFMKANELADSLRRAAGIAHASSNIIL